MFLFSQNFTHSPGINAIVRSDVVLKLAAKMSQPNIDRCFICKLRFFHFEVP